MHPRALPPMKKTNWGGALSKQRSLIQIFGKGSPNISETTSSKSQAMANHTHGQEEMQVGSVGTEPDPLLPLGGGSAQPGEGRLLNRRRA